MKETEEVTLEYIPNILGSYYPVAAPMTKKQAVAVLRAMPGTAYQVTIRRSGVIVHSENSVRWLLNA